MSTIQTNLIAAFAALLIAVGTIGPVVTVPQADSVTGIYAPELA
ncbi:hypothetical protein [Qipengyuania oceanensis]|nr:hypothetical protein [Qipengyuania oceanensis]